MVKTTYDDSVRAPYRTKTSRIINSKLVPALSQSNVNRVANIMKKFHLENPTIAPNDHVEGRVRVVNGKIVSRDSPENLERIREFATHPSEDAAALTAAEEGQYFPPSIVSIKSQLRRADPNYGKAKRLGSAETTSLPQMEGHGGKSRRNKHTKRTKRSKKYTKRRKHRR